MINPLDHPIILMVPRRLTPFSAWHEHIPFAFFIVDALRPQVIVELGTAYGDSYCAFCQAVEELSLSTRCYAVDTWRGDPHTGFYGPEVLADLRAHHDPLYGTFSRLIQSTFDEALEHFPNGSIDLLHIDGYHTYEAVKHDFQSWLPKLSTRGVVLLHDISVTERGFGVKRLWDEVKTQYPSFEFPHGYGLGVLAVGEEQPKAFRELLETAPEEAARLRNLFSSLGRRLTPQVQCHQLHKRLNEYEQRATISLDVERRCHSQINQDPLVSIIIPTYNKWEFTAKCLESLFTNTNGIPHEIIIVDNASTDGTRESLSQLGGSVRLLLNDCNLGFAKACNQGARMAKGKYLVFLNNDTEPQAGWLEAMVQVVESDPSVAIVGSKLLFPDGTIQHAGVGFMYAAPYPITPYHLNYRRPANSANNTLELRAVTGACMLIRANVFHDVGGFDEGYQNGYEDVDLCLKVRETGGRIIFTPESVLIHHESATTGRHAKESENLNLLHRRWMSKFTAFDYNYYASTQPSYVDPDRPGVSIVIVTYNSLPTIAPCLESLLLHTGPQDEIILVDNASQDATMLFVNLFLMRNPGKVKTIRNSKNIGFSRAINLGLQSASKDYVVLLNPDVQVTPGWIDRMLTHLLKHPKVGAVGPTSNCVAGLQKVELYSDVDPNQHPNTVSAKLEKHFRGQAKETQLLIGFCLLTRRKLLQEMGNLDPDLFLGNDDLDISLRLRQRGLKLLVAIDAFVHHYGQVSFRSEPSSKTKYLVQQSTNMLYEKLYQRYNGKVPTGEELWGISWFKPQIGLTSIIVVADGDAQLIQRCVDSIYGHTYRSFELILVDNGSKQHVAEYTAMLQKQHSNVTYLRNDEKENWAYACNQGLALAKGEFVALLHDDVVVSPGWLSKLLAIFSTDPLIGIVGISNDAAQLEQRDNTDNASSLDLSQFVELANQWFLDHAGQFSLVTQVASPCVVIKRDVLLKIGGLDTRYVSRTVDFSDLCLRAVRAGYKNAIANDVFVCHYHNTLQLDVLKGQRYPEDQIAKEDWKLFCHKWGCEGDIAQECNLEQLAAGRAFDENLDYVPVRYEDVFNPEILPLQLEQPQPVKFLCIPDWTNSSWKKIVSAYVNAFNSNDSVSLIIRVEPPSTHVTEAAWNQISTLLQQLAVPEESTPDIILESTPLPPWLRGSLYTGASFFLPCDGTYAHIYLREAKACGLEILDTVTPESLHQATTRNLSSCSSTATQLG